MQGHSEGAFCCQKGLVTKSALAEGKAKSVTEQGRRMWTLTNGLSWVSTLQPRAS